MAGELTALVLIPRYTTLVGANTFTTVGLEVVQYSKALANVWRSTMIGSSGTFQVSFEESTDGVTWTVCTNGGAADPGADTEIQYTPQINKRWFRVKVVTTGTDVGVTCWVVGFLEQRET